MALCTSLLSEVVMNIHPFPLPPFDQLFDVIMTSVAGFDTPFLDHFTVISSMAKDARWFLVVNYLFEHV